MTKKEQTMENIKELYIEGFDIDRIAKILNKTIGTIQQYKSQDKKAGNDWDELRNRKLKKSLNYTNVNKDGDLHSSFTNQMRRAIDNINEDKELKPLEKTKALAQIADSYSKIIKIASNINPEKYILSIIKAHLDLILKITYSSNNKELHNGLLDLLNKGDYLKEITNIKETYINKIMLEEIEEEE